MTIGKNTDLHNQAKFAVESLMGTNRGRIYILHKTPRRLPFLM